MGDYVAVMDADLQDPPELFPDMVKILGSGEYDGAAVRRINRGMADVIVDGGAEPFFQGDH